MSKQYQLKSSDFYSTEDLLPEAVLDEADPIMDLKRLAGMGNESSLNEYTGYNSIPKTETSNVSHTANEKIIYQQENNVQPGSSEWFRLWFSKPYLTGEKPW